MKLRFVASLVIGLTVLGCSKAVEMPRSDIDEAQHYETGSYRIRLKGREEYLVKRFSVTDSTIVIEELMPADERYRLERASLPIEIPVVRLESIAALQMNTPVTYGLIVGTVLLIAMIISINNIELGY